MTTASAVEHKQTRPKTIQHNTLLEDLYTNYSLSQLQSMLESEPDKVFLHNWNVSGEKLRKNLAVAIYFIKND